MDELKISLIWFVVLNSFGLVFGNEIHCTRLTSHKDLSGDYIIAGIFPVHYYSSRKAAFVFNPVGLTWVEAMLLAIDEINNNTSLLPGIKLGYALYDSCNAADFGLQATLDIIKEPSVIPSATKKQSYSQSKQLNATECFCNKTKPSIIAVVGDAASASSTRIASVVGARGVRMPQISYSSTSTVLSNKKYYPSFLRTIPPDDFQAKFIIDILKEFKWTYVSFIASDDAYGRLGVENLLPRLESEGICVAISEVFDTSSKGKEKVAQIVRRLSHDKRSRVTVLWCQYPQAEVFLKEAEKQRFYDRMWIATETWGSNSLVKNVNQRVVSGLLGIIPTSVVYEPFEKYLLSLSPNNSQYNPWLHLFWEKKMGCKAIDNKTYRCDRDEKPNANGLPRNKFANVMDAVYSVANALHNALFMQNNIRPRISPELLLNHLWTVQFVGKANLTVSFNSNGDPGVASYSLTNLQRDGKGGMDYKIVGGWNSKTRKLKILPNSNIVFANWTSMPPNSTCSENCKPGYYALTFTSKPCCWTCAMCPVNTVQPKAGQKSCGKCAGESVPNAMRTKCVIPIYKYLKFTSAVGITMLVCSLIAVLIVFCFFVVMIRNWNTPLIKAMNRELSTLQLSSMIFIYAMPVLYMIKPSGFTCGLRPFYFVIFYTISVSVTFTKTDRLLRIFKASVAGRLSKNSRVLNNRIQLLTVAALTILACVVCTIFYFVFQPVLVQKIERNKTGVEMRFSCGNDFKVLFLILLCYIGGISFTCSIFAFRARKLPENYNEARYTSFAMFSFCLAWLFFLPLYFSMETEIDREIVILVISFLSTVARLLILYGPKLIVILFHPEENTVERFRAKLKTQRSKRSSSSASQNARMHSQATQSPAKRSPKPSKASPVVAVSDKCAGRNPAYEISIDNDVR